MQHYQTAITMHNATQIQRGEIFTEAPCLTCMYSSSSLYPACWNLNRFSTSAVHPLALLMDFGLELLSIVQDIVKGLLSGDWQNITTLILLPNICLLTHRSVYWTVGWYALWNKMWGLKYKKQTSFNKFHSEKKCFFFQMYLCRTDILTLKL